MTAYSYMDTSGVTPDYNGVRVVKSADVDSYSAKWEMLADMHAVTGSSEDHEEYQDMSVANLDQLRPTDTDLMARLEARMREDQSVLVAKIKKQAEYEALSALKKLHEESDKVPPRKKPLEVPVTSLNAPRYVTDVANKIVHEIKQHQHVYMQDELLAKWHSGGHGKAVQYSVLGRVKSKVKMFAANVLLASEPTTKLCYNCGQLHDMPVSKRVYVCDCGLPPEDRDVHSAKNMVYMSKILVPAGRREFKREEPLASVQGSSSLCKPLAWSHEAATSLASR